MATDTVVAADAWETKATGEAADSPTAIGPISRARIRRRLKLKALDIISPPVNCCEWTESRRRQ
jgi:hypothetical protein